MNISVVKATKLNNIAAIAKGKEKLNSTIN